MSMALQFGLIMLNWNTIDLYYKMTIDQEWDKKTVYEIMVGKKL